MCCCIRLPLSLCALPRLSFTYSTSKGVIRQRFGRAWGLSAGESLWQQQSEKAGLFMQARGCGKSSLSILLNPFILGHRPAILTCRAPTLPCLCALPTPPSLRRPSASSFVTNPGAGTWGEAAVASINLPSCCLVFDSNERGRRDEEGWRGMITEQTPGVLGSSLLFCKPGYGRLIDLGAVEQTRQSGSSLEH